MRFAIHPVVFLLGSLLLCAAWLAVRPAPPTPGMPGAALSERPAAPRRERKTIELPREALKRYVGSYRMDASIDVTIDLDAAGHLFAQAPGTPRYELRPTSESTFFTRGIDSDIEFKVDAAGRAESFDAHFATGTITAERVR